MLSEDDMRRRLEFLCEFYRDISSGSKSLKELRYIIAAKKRKTTEKPGASPGAAGTEKPKKKQSKLVERDEEGNIVYPIILNPSLSILNMGRIEYERPGYHTAKYEAIFKQK